MTDATVDSQLIQLQGTGADVLISGVTGKFGAMSIRKVFDLGWKPLHFITSGVSSVSSTIKPAGEDRWAPVTPLSAFALSLASWRRASR